MPYKLIILALVFSKLSYGQTGTPVFLKWKLQPNEVISYKTIMKDVDGSDADFSLNMDDLHGVLADSAKKNLDEIKKAFSAINRSVDDYDFITTMSERKKSVIDIEMSLLKKDTTTSTNSGMDLMKLASGNVVLRGALTEEGVIQSFYLKYDQKNLIAIMFELPGKPVSIGDKWALNVNFISMDQNFTCDSAFKRNVVTLVDVKTNGNETIAVVKYDILEYVNGDFKSPFSNNSTKTMMKMSFNGLAEFSLDKGRWVNFDGIMLLNASGVMNSNTTKKFGLQAN